MGDMYQIGSWRELAQSEHSFDIELDRTALVCVDIQKKTVDRNAPRGMSKTIAARDPELAEWYFSKVENQVMPNVVRLQRFFRERGGRVMHFVVGPGQRDASDMPFKFRHGYSRGLNAEEVGYVVKGDPEFEICDEVGPEDGELVVHKVTMGGFTGTGTEALLRNMGVDTIVLVGGHTHACVEASGRAAADLGFRVAIVEDAVINYMPLMHDAAMINFATFIGRVTTTDELVEELSGAARPRATVGAAARSMPTDVSV